MEVLEINQIYKKENCLFRLFGTRVSSVDLTKEMILAEVRLHLIGEPSIAQLITIIIHNS